jgi:hypothetical protein
LPYAQILDQHFPGLMFLPINFNNLGMTTPDAARLWQIGVVILTHIFLYILSKKIFKSSSIAVSANIFYLLWHPVLEGWILWVDSFIPLFLLPSAFLIVSFFEKKRLKHIFFAGLLLGAAIVFKQVLIPLAGVSAIFLLIKTKSAKTTALFCFGIALPVLLMVIYLAGIGVLNDFIFWTISFNLGTFAQMGRKYMNFGDILLLVKVYLPPVIIAILYFIKTKKQELVIVAIFFVLSLAFAYARYDLVHLQPSLPFLALLAPTFFLFAPKKILKVTLLIYLVPALILVGHYYQLNKGSRVLFFGDHEKKITEVVQRETSRSDKIFSLASVSHIYFLADRLPAGNIFAFPFPWFFVDGEDKILNGLLEDPPKLILRDPNAIVEGRVLIDWAPKINSYINSNYKLERVVDGVEILKKK